MSIEKCITEFLQIKFNFNGNKFIFWCQFICLFKFSIAYIFQIEQNVFQLNFE